MAYFPDQSLPFELLVVVIELRTACFSFLGLSPPHFRGLLFLLFFPPILFYSFLPLEKRFCEKLALLPLNSRMLESSTPNLTGLGQTRALTLPPPLAFPK